MAAETAADVARKLEDRLCQVLAYDGKTVSVGATIGVATFPRDGDDLHTLLRSADHAMYRRKREKESQA
jgi:predicted signal transduction protein with EAL and GGDEF domain